MTSTEYPSLIVTERVWTNTSHNASLIPRNYATSLRYQCGAARMFLNSDGSHQATQNMSCGWDRSWSEDTALLECDWVACLQPPAPPTVANLRQANRHV